jgi:C1A family cysteine protease
MTEVYPFPKQDPRLDWVSKHDPRSLEYPIRSIVGTSVEERAVSWATGSVLDQGSEGACVGFGWTGELLASPRPSPYTSAASANQYARGVYYAAKQIDEFTGEDYEGTSVIAGANVIRNRGLIGEYRWALSIEDVRAAVITQGPVVIGIPWYSEMYSTRPSGLVKTGGELVGGHCILITGYHPGMRIQGEDYDERFRVFRWRNSWGLNYGRSGTGFVRYEDLRDLLANWGEACVPMARKLVRI